MDGTTASQIGLTPLNSLVPPPSASAGTLLVSHSPNPTDLPPMPPVVTPDEATSQQRYSQLTPVYAQTPTNTPADIPQPSVKGIEFIKTPAASVPALVSVPNLVEPLQKSIPPESTYEQGLETAQAVTRDLHLQRIENEVADPDLDKTVAVAPAQLAAYRPIEQGAINPQHFTQAIVTKPSDQNTPLVTPVVKPEPSQPNVNNYFQSGPDKSIQSDVVIDPSSALSSQKKSNPIFKKVGIILAIVIVLGAGGYLVVHAIMSNQHTKSASTAQPSNTSTTTTPTTVAPIATPTPSDSSTGTTTTTPTTPTTPKTPAPSVAPVAPAATPTPTPTPTPAPSPTPAIPDTGVR
jgi:hypothetical protein